MVGERSSVIVQMGDRVNTVNMVCALVSCVGQTICMFQVTSDFRIGIVDWIRVYIGKSFNMGL